MHAHCLSNQPGPRGITKLFEVFTASVLIIHNSMCYSFLPFSMIFFTPTTFHEDKNIVFYKEKLHLIISIKTI